VVGVDNVLVVPADPGFIGFALDGKVEASNLVCLKKEPHERVGVMCLRDGKPSVVEYSEISKSMAEAVGTDGVLVYSAANLANHWFSLDLVKKVLKTILPFHVATKAIKCVSKDGKSSAKPEKPNGIKLEMFIFDSFPLTDGNMSAYAIERNAHFAPVKNKVKPGASSTPITARRAVSAYHKALAIASGAVLEGEGIFEISPLVSIAGEGLTEIVQGQTYVLPGVLTPTGYKQTTTVASAI
jgi:UDP-N-acetylglucosamine/UDP-N-acetylgalactosamine diphosphorylase